MRSKNLMSRFTRLQEQVQCCEISDADEAVFRRKVVFTLVSRPLSCVGPCDEEKDKHDILMHQWPIRVLYFKPHCCKTQPLSQIYGA